MTWTLTKKRMGKLENAFNTAAWCAVKTRNPDMEMFCQGAMFAMRYVLGIVENGSDMELYDWKKMENALVNKYDEICASGKSFDERFEAYMRG